MDYIFLAFLLLGVSCIAMAITNITNCPPPQIIYRYIPKHTLDVQFGDENNPSTIYRDMFTSSSPWIGGYTMGIGKTYKFEERQNKK